MEAFCIYNVDSGVLCTVSFFLFPKIVMPMITLYILVNRQIGVTSSRPVSNYCVTELFPCDNECTVKDIATYIREIDVQMAPATVKAFVFADD